MLLQLSTWPEVERYLESSVGTLMPIGSTEQHGPNGLIGTDAICAEVIARAAGEAANAMVGPIINVGMAQHHMAFTGSMTLRPSTLIALIRDCVASLAKHGFARLYFVNGHGGNTATIGAAFDEIYADASLGGTSGVRCKSVNWWRGPRTRKLRIALRRARRGARDAVRDRRHLVRPPRRGPRGGLRFRGRADAALRRCRRLPRRRPRSPSPGSPTPARSARRSRRFPDGRIGSDPSLAAAADGERLIEAAAADIAEDYQNFLADG